MVTNFGQNKYSLCPLPSFTLFPYIVSTGSAISELIFPSLNGFGSLISLPHIFSCILVYEYKREGRERRKGESGSGALWAMAGHKPGSKKVPATAASLCHARHARVSLAYLDKHADTHTLIHSHTHTHAGNTCKHLGMSTKYVY